MTCPCGLPGPATTCQHSDTLATVLSAAPANEVVRVAPPPRMPRLRWRVVGIAPLRLRGRCGPAWEGMSVTTGEDGVW